MWAVRVSAGFSKSSGVPAEEVLGFVGWFQAMLSLFRLGRGEARN